MRKFYEQPIVEQVDLVFRETIASITNPQSGIDTDIEWPDEW